MSAAQQRRSSRTWLRIALLLVGAAAFALALRNADLDRAVSLVGALGALALLALVPHAFAMLAHAAAWRQLLGVFGHRLSLGRVTADHLAAEAARMSLPAGPAFGESLAALLIHRAGVPLGDAVGSLATKKLLVAFSNAAVCALALWLAHDAILAATPPFGLSAQGLWWILAATALGLLALSLALAALMKARPLAARLPRLTHPLTRQHLPALASPALLLTAQWLLEVFETYLIATLLGVELSLQTVLAIEMVASSLRSAAFFLPSGLGVQDAGYVAMFAAFGVPEAATVGAAFIVLERLKDLAWMGAGYLLLAQRRHDAFQPAEMERT